jgi:hypothetical protein
MVLVELARLGWRLTFVCQSEHVEHAGTTRRFRHDPVSHANDVARAHHGTIYLHVPRSAGKARQVARFEDARRAKPAIDSNAFHAWLPDELAAAFSSV